MGAAESTTRTNVTEEEEERQRAPSASSTAAGAAMALAAVGAAAWGISRMVSENKTETNDAMVAQSYTLPKLRNYIPESIPRTIWSPPPPGRYKMNTDGSSLEDQGPLVSYDHHAVKRGPSGFAGVLRDHRGNWVQGFHGFIGESDSLTAEFYGIYHGLLVLDEIGLKEATLDSDCEAAVKWIKQENTSNTSRSPIIYKCWEMIITSRRLVAKNKITLCHCSGESNKLADKLADIAIQKQDEYKVLVDVPAEMKRILDQESRFA